MSLVAVCSVSGSPGVSTTAIALAHAWPREACVAELDVSGGDLHHRLRRPDGSQPPFEPSLVHYQAAGRGDRVDVRDYLQATASGVNVLFGLESAEQGPPMRNRWPHVASGLASSSPDVIADLGRFLPDSPLTSVVHVASALVMVVPATLEGYVHARDRLAAIPRQMGEGRRVPPMGVIVVTEDRHAGEDCAAIEHVLAAAGLAAVTVFGFVAHDRRTVERMNVSPLGSREKLVRSARPVAQRIAEFVPEPRAAVDASTGAATRAATSPAAPPWAAGSNTNVMG